jgi:hypothetical protein
MTVPGSNAPAFGPWVERWLSQERFATYLTAAGSDPSRALALYEWNVAASAALLHDLAHLEVALRNAYDRALRTGSDLPWTDVRSPLFAPLTHGPAQADINARFREQLASARRSAANVVVGTPRHGDVVAQLGFGFWRYLSSKRHEKALWVPYLHQAFVAGTDRALHVDQPLTRLHRIRNRVAHHEPLLRVDLVARLADVCALAVRLDQDLGRYVWATSSVGRCATERPSDYAVTGAGMGWSAGTWRIATLFMQ